jgi:flotillin
MSTGLIALLGVVALVVVLVALVLSRIRVAGPNEAFIITGRKGRPVRNPETGEISTDMSGQKVVMGASVFVIPLVQKLHIMDLSSRRIPVGITGAVSAQGIKCDLEGVAIVKVGGNEDAIRAGAQRFLTQQQGIEAFTQEVLAGSLRAIVGRLTVEEIIRDRAAFASAVAEEAETSLTNQGLVLDTFQLQDIRAEGEYLRDLGRPEAARVAKEAAIAEAKARQAAEQERLLAEEAIAVSNRQLALRQAEIQAETDAALAEAAAAGPLAQAAEDQKVIAEREKVAVRQAALRERELDTDVRRPADADRYRIEQGAEADRARREAAAAAVEREGRAEAAAYLAQGEAEAEAMSRKAEAFERYGQAAVLDILVSTLPEVVRAASEPVGRIDQLTVISTEGASDVTRAVAGNVAQGMQIASDLTGVDLGQLFTTLTARVAGSGDGDGDGDGGAARSVETHTE